MEAPTVRLTEAQLVEILSETSRVGRALNAGDLKLYYEDFGTAKKWVVLGPDGEEYLTVINSQAFRDTRELRMHLEDLAQESPTGGEPPCDLPDIPTKKVKNASAD